MCIRHIETGHRSVYARFCLRDPKVIFWIFSASLCVAQKMGDMGEFFHTNSRVVFYIALAIVAYAYKRGDARCDNAGCLVRWRYKCA